MSEQIISIHIESINPKNGMPVQFRATAPFRKPHASRITTDIIDQSKIDTASYSKMSETFYVSFSNQYSKEALIDVIQDFADSIGAKVSS